MYKRIKGFENYMVSRKCDVINIKRMLSKIPTSNNAGKGYLYVDLYNNGNKKRFLVHRLVAEAFIPNPQNKAYINHIDGNPKNNSVENLEWCSPLENVEHASKVLGVMSAYTIANQKRQKQVKMVDRFTNKVVATFDSIGDAERKTNIKSSNIVANLKGRQSYTKNYYWQYVEEKE